MRFREFLMEIGTSTGCIAGFARITLPLVRRTWPPFVTFDEPDKSHKRKRKRKRKKQPQVEEGNTPRSFIDWLVQERLPLLDEKSKNWIQGAINKKHSGFCTPMTKKTCTPRRKALAKRFKHGDLHED